MSFDVGVIGLGKLGLPMAVAIAEQGHSVFGYDIDDEKLDLIKDGRGVEATGSWEPDLDDRLKGVLHNAFTPTDSLLSLALSTELIFVVVPTPPASDRYFDTSHLEAALGDLATALESIDSDRRHIVSIVSTMLPGTTRELAGILDDSAAVCHTPAFTAMTSTIEDYLDPEFALIGADDTDAADTLEMFYVDTLPYGPPIRRVSWESAELTKLTYNTMIGVKIAFANTVLRVCHQTPEADVDDVTATLKLADRRLTSSKYLTGGMSDGGPCHPKDNSALAAWYDGGGNIFEFAVNARTSHTNWIADVVIDHADGDPVTVVGARYKPESTLTLGSPSLLLADTLESVVDGGWGGLERVTVYDPDAGYDTDPPDRGVFVATVDAPFVREYPYPNGSTVIDVWRCLDLPATIEHVPLGAEQAGGE